MNPYLIAVPIALVVGIALYFIMERIEKWMEKKDQDSDIFR